MERGQIWKVLDHGYVKLIDWMGSDETIVDAARMSTGRGFVSWDPYERCKTCEAAWRKNPGGSYSLVPGFSAGPCCDNVPMTTEKFPRGDFGMLNKLYSSRHTSPFEMSELAIEVQAPIMVFREWHRHRTQSYSEFSARYAQMPNLHYLPDPSRIQKQSTANKQGSAEALPEHAAAEVVRKLELEQAAIYDQYDALVSHGIAKEVARLNTPVSRYSKMRAKTDLANWLKFLALRMDKAAQWEIRQYADVVGKIISVLWPRTWELFLEHTFNAVTFSASEMKILRTLISAPPARLEDKLVQAVITKVRD